MITKEVLNIKNIKIDLKHLYTLYVYQTHTFLIQRTIKKSYTVANVFQWGEIKGYPNYLLLSRGGEISGGPAGSGGRDENVILFNEYEDIDILEMNGISEK